MSSDFSLLVNVYFFKLLPPLDFDIYFLKRLFINDSKTFIKFKYDKGSKIINKLFFNSNLIRK